VAEGAAMMGNVAIASVVIVFVAITAVKLRGLDSASAQTYWILSALCAGAAIVVVVDGIKRLKARR
jgi:hypothetical protein